KYEIESYLNNYLGISNVIWLKEGIIGDDTDGHIDDIARFVNKITVVCAFEENQNDKNHKILKNNYEILCNSRYQAGKKFNIIRLPMPKPVESGNIRLPASYTNFYIANKIVLVPIFNQENDKKAIQILERLFPSRDIIGIDCRDLVFGLGAIHCVTQQEPKA
ncbi:MAG: agmatine deiminase family protein, partial [Nanoarchaeota archaeon]